MLSLVGTVIGHYRANHEAEVLGSRLETRLDASISAVVEKALHGQRERERPAAPPKLHPEGRQSSPAEGQRTGIWGTLDSWRSAYKTGSSSEWNQKEKLHALGAVVLASVAFKMV